jgi:hypothetical protein
VLAEPSRRSERVRRRADGLEVEVVEGELPFAWKRYEIDPDGRLVLRATLSRPVPPLGLAEPVRKTLVCLAEPVRKTLVFHLASELLALTG